MMRLMTRHACIFILSCLDSEADMESEPGDTLQDETVLKMLRELLKNQIEDLSLDFPPSLDEHYTYFLYSKTAQSLCPENFEWKGTCCCCVIGFPCLSHHFGTF